MHNAAFAALGLNWRYLAFEVRPDDLRAAIAGAKAMQFSGLNLTVPHKLLAMQIVDELDESAKTWGAVNTVRFEGRGTAAGQLAAAARTFQNRLAGGTPDERVSTPIPTGSPVRCVRTWL